MKNTKLFPFERNRYYYGKLLSVGDFNAEQKYINDKRRLINRLVCGTGVVSGLNATRVDDRTICVDCGLAFDGTGREIVVDAPVITKLSLINGYDDAVSDGGAYVYLCLEYRENETGESYSIESKTDCGRIGEGFGLYLTRAEPEDDVENGYGLFEEKTTVFRDGSIMVKHILPAYVHPDKRFEMRVEIETHTARYAAFSYDIQLVCLNTFPDNSSVLRVNFDEAFFEKTGKYTLKYELCAADVSDTAGELRVDPNTFALSYDKQSAEGVAEGNCSVKITSENITGRVMREYYRRGMDSVLRSSVGQRLYLARIDLVNAGDSVVIGNVENVPFGQYVRGLPLLGSVVESGAAQNNVTVHGFPSVCTPKNSSDGTAGISSGVCRISLNGGGFKNKVFYSDEIVHGLGLGGVTVITGILTENGGIVFGNGVIFKNDALKIDVAVKSDPSRGSFVIGIMARAAVLAEYVDIKWTALRDTDEAASPRSGMRLSIKPNTLVLKPRESRYFEAVCSNMTNKTVRWSVVSEFGGEIDANGLYSAPSVEGVYEIMAQSALYPEIKASVMVVVRE